VGADLIMTNSPTDGLQLAFSDVTADPAAATHLRQALAEWLEEQVPSAGERAEAITLAAYEAMANAVEHAYAGRTEVGTMSLRATYHPGDKQLHVTVQDQGRWLEPTPTTNRLRGRGIPLMQALSDHPRIKPGPGGTIVNLEWNLAQPVED
jgi:serine/threonine-protein kinase RsbW